MRPSELPLSPSGKVDRRALPAPSKDRAAAGSQRMGPRNLTELRLTQVWEELLDLRPLGVTDRFFDLGGHSLLAMRAAAAIEQRLDVRVPIARILTAPTPRRLAAELHGPDRGPRLLVPISQGTQEFFVVHGAGGNVVNLRPLADRLLPDIGVVGIQAVGADGEGTPLRSVVEMADRYTAEVRGRQPHGPYRIGGFSGGGVIALEVASRLRNEGAEVDLVLFDTYSPTATIQPVTTMMHLRNLLAEGPRYLAHRVKSRLDRRRQGRLDRGDQRGATLEQTIDHRMAEAMVAAIADYDPVVYDGPVLLLSARKENSAYRHNGEDRGWGDLLPQLDIERVDGNHESIMYRGNVEPVAAVIHRWLTR